jgi:hypothetical protein
LKEILARKSLRVTQEFRIVGLPRGNHSGSVARFGEGISFQSQGSVRRFMSWLAIYRQCFCAEELATVIGTVCGVPTPRNVMPRSGGWLLILDLPRYWLSPTVVVDRLLWGS